MQASQRASWNPALEYAVALGDELGLPVLGSFGLTPDYPEANFRAYASWPRGFGRLRATSQSGGFAS